MCLIYLKLSVLETMYARDLERACSPRHSRWTGIQNDIPRWDSSPGESVLFKTETFSLFLLLKNRIFLNPCSLLIFRVAQNTFDTGVMVTIGSLKFDWFSYHKQQRQLSIVYVQEELCLRSSIPLQKNGK